MLAAEAQASAQLISPLRAVHIFVELVIQVTFYARLLQPADRTALFAARLQQFVDGEICQLLIVLSNSQRSKNLIEFSPKVAAYVDFTILIHSSLY